MSLTTHQYQSLHLASCDLAEQLPSSQFLASLVAIYEAGRLLHMTKSTLVGLLGSVALRCVDREIDDEVPPVPPAAGLWPRLVRAAAYDDQGNLALAGVDDNDRPWHESVTGRSQEAWLLKQLYVERKFGRRPRQGKGRKKAAR